MADAQDARIGLDGGELMLQVAQFQQPQLIAEQIGRVVCGILPAALAEWMLEQDGVEDLYRPGTFSICNLLDLAVALTQVWWRGWLVGLL